MESVELAKVYYIRKRGKVLGPISVEDAKRRIKKNELARFDQISEDGQHWIKAAEDKGLFPQAPPPSVKPAMPQEEMEPLAGAANYDLPTLSINADDASEDDLEVLKELVSEELQPAEAGIVSDWYFADGEQTVGPITECDLQHLIVCGQLTADDRVWYADPPGWCLVRDVPRLAVVETPSARAAPVSPPSGLAFVDETTAKVSRFASASLLFGILGLTLLPVVGCVVSVVVGHLALRDLGRTGTAADKLIVAVAGTVTGYVGLALWAILFLVLILRANAGA